MLPSNTHICDWDLISHDPFIHDPSIVNEYQWSISDTHISIFNNTTSNLYNNSLFDYIHWDPNKTDLNFEKGS